MSFLSGILSSCSVPKCSDSSSFKSIFWSRIASFIVSKEMNNFNEFLICFTEEGERESILKIDKPSHIVDRPWTAARTRNHSFHRAEIFRQTKNWSTRHSPVSIRYNSLQCYSFLSIIDRQFFPLFTHTQFKYILRLRFRFSIFSEFVWHLLRTKVIPIKFQIRINYIITLEIQQNKANQGINRNGLLLFLNRNPVLNLNLADNTVGRIGA